MTGAVQTIGICLACVFGLALICVGWVAWYERRSFQCWRRFVGGRWAHVRWTVHFGMHAVHEWKPEDEVREADHVLTWEDEAERTRVRGRKP